MKIAAENLVGEHKKMCSLQEVVGETLRRTAGQQSMEVEQQHGTVTSAPPECAEDARNTTASFCTATNSTASTSKSEAGAQPPPCKFKTRVLKMIYSDSGCVRSLFVSCDQPAGHGRMEEDLAGIAHPPGGVAERASAKLLHAPQWR